MRIIHHYSMTSAIFLLSATLLAVLLATISGSAHDQTKASGPIVRKDRMKRKYFFGLGHFQIYATHRKNGVLFDVVAFNNYRSEPGRRPVTLFARRMEKAQHRPGVWYLFEGLYKRGQVIIAEFNTLPMDAETGAILS